MAKYGVLIGRFQPCHNGHLSTIRQALDKVDNQIIDLVQLTHREQSRIRGQQMNGCR